MLPALNCFSRKPRPQPRESSDLPKYVVQVCRAPVSVAHSMKQGPTANPQELAQQLYKTHHLKIFDSPPPKTSEPVSHSELENAKKCGNFGTTRPSVLFLQAFHDMLGTLESDALSSCVSPSMVGTTGICPFAIIGPL